MRWHVEKGDILGWTPSASYGFVLITCTTFENNSTVAHWMTEHTYIINILDKGR